MGRAAAGPPRLQPGEVVWWRCLGILAQAWASLRPFGGCDAAHRPLCGQPGCSWAPPSQPAHSNKASNEVLVGLQRLGPPARPTSRRVARACLDSKRGAAQKRSPLPVYGPASSAGQSAAGAGTDGHQPPQDTQWRAPDSPSTQPCLRRKLRASLAPTLSHARPSGSPVQACGRPASQLGLLQRTRVPSRHQKRGPAPPAH